MPVYMSDYGEQHITLKSSVERNSTGTLWLLSKLIFLIYGIRIAKLCPAEGTQDFGSSSDELSHLLVL